MSQVIVINPPELTEIVESSFRKLFNEFFTAPQKKEEIEKPKSIKEAAEFLNLSVQTIYGLTSQKKISHTKKGNKLFFYEADLLNYLNSGKQKSQKDLELEVEMHLGNLGEKKMSAKPN